MTTSPDLVIFDLDGTLTDPIEGISRCLNFSLGLLGYPQRDVAELACHVGPPLDQAFRALTGSGDEQHITDLVAGYRQRYATVGYAENIVYEGVPEILDRLTAAATPMGVCTSKRVDFAEQILELFGLRDHFEFVDGGDVGIEKWQQIHRLKHQGVVHGHAVLIGDRGVDVTAAKRNGIMSIGVLWGYGSREELQSHGADHIVATPDDLAVLLGL